MDPFSRRRTPANRSTAAAQTTTDPLPRALPRYCGSGPTATGRDGSEHHSDQEPT